MFTLCILKNYNIRKNCYHTMLPAGQGARAWSGIEEICCESFLGEGELLLYQNEKWKSMLIYILLP